MSRRLVRQIFRSVTIPFLVALRLVRRLARQKTARREVFIDCGSNTCTVLEDRIQKRLDTEFFCFEPQAELVGYADEIIRRYPDIPIHFFNKAIWIADGTATLYLATNWGPNYKGGSTLLRGHVKNAAEVDYARPVTVECLDFSQWIKNNFSKRDRLVLKMDVEGAEYPVLEKMITDGSIDYIDELIIEFHWQMNDELGKARHDLLMKKLEGRVQIHEWH